MALASIQAEYAQDAAETAIDIDENGHRCSFGVLGSPDKPWMPPTAYQEIGKAAVLPLAWAADFSGDVRQDDRMFMVSPVIYILDREYIPLGEWIAGIDEFGGYREFLREGNTDAPTYTHMIDAQGKQRSIVTVKPFNLDGVSTIFYEIQAR